MEYLEHTTREGERWDQLAALYYGDAYSYERIITANPQVPITPALAAGLCLRIPLLEDELDRLQELPPWKQ